MSAAQPGWYADPTQQAEYRYFDGSNWTDQVQSGTPVSHAPSLPPSAPEVTGAWWEQSASVSQPATTEAGQSFHDQNTVSIAARSLSSLSMPVQPATPQLGNYPQPLQVGVAPPQPQPAATWHGNQPSPQVSPYRKVVIGLGILLQLAVLAPWLIVQSISGVIEFGDSWEAAPLLTYDFAPTEVPIGLLVIGFFVLASAISSAVLMSTNAPPAGQLAILSSIFVLGICAAYVARTLSLITGLEGLTKLIPGPGLLLPIIGSLLVIGGCLGALSPSKSA